MKKLFLLALIFFFLVSVDAFAGQRYYVGGNSTWNTSANWSSTIGGGGGGAGGASVPSTNDTAYFNTGDTCTMDANGSVKRMEITGGKLLQSTYTLTFGTSGATFSGGTFAGGSGAITASGVITISGCAFTSTSGTLTTNSNFTVSSGSFTHNSGTLLINATMTLSVSVTGGATFYHINFAPTAANTTITVTSTTTINVAGTLYIGGTKTTVFNTGTINIQGNINTASASVQGGGGSGIFNINGTGGQTLTGNTTAGYGRLPDVIINKSSDTLKLVSTISTDGDWTYTAGIISAGTSTVYFMGSHTVSGTHALNNVTRTTGVTWTISSGDTLKVNGTFKVVNANGLTINSGVVAARGNIDVSAYTHNSGGGSATILIDGTGDQTYTGTSGAGDGRLPNIRIKKSSGTLHLVNFIFCVGNWTYTSGTIDYGTSTVQFRYSGMTVSGTHSLYNVVFYGDVAITYNVSGTLTTHGTLSFNGTGAITINSGTINAKGNITTTNTSTSTTGTTTIVINGRTSQTLTGSGTVGAGKLPNITIDKDSGNVTLASIISCTGHWIYTGIDTGTVIPGTSTVAFYGNFNLDGRSSVSPYPMMHFYRIQVAGGTRTLTGDVYCNENFVFATGTTVTASTYDITLKGNWNGQGTWSHGNDTINFIGSSFNKIQGPSGGTVNYAHVTFDRRGGSVTCVNPVTIDSSMVLAMGRIKTTTTNYLQFGNDAKCFVTNDDSAYVHGPVRKVGNDAFSFPLGDTTLHDSVAYHPLGISAPSSTSDRFQAIYLATVQTQGSTIVDSLVDLSTCEHWSLERQVGSSNVLVTLSWNKNSCNTDVYGNLRVANWNSTQWADLGATSISIYGYRGTVAGGTNAVFVGGIAYLTTAVAKNNFPTAILKKKLDGGYYQAINGRLFFRFDEEYAETGDLLFNIYDDEHNLVSTTSMLPSTLQPQVVYGDNRYHLNTVGCDITPSGVLANGFYILEVINDKNEKWYLRFEQDANIIISNCPPPTEEE